MKDALLTTLKKLRLSGLAETLDVRLQEASRKLLPLWQACNQPQDRLAIREVDIRLHLDRDLDQQVTACSLSVARHSQAAHPEYIADLCARGNGQFARPVERGHFDHRAQRRLRIGDGHVAQQVLAVAPEERMFGDRDEHVAIAAWSSFGARLALARQAESVTFCTPLG